MPRRALSVRDAARAVPPIRVPAHYRIIAHRGASAYAPENTLPAFALARAMGVTDVELDTQLSADGVVVLCHDTTLERYGHGRRVLEGLPARELLSLDMGSWFSPHRFAATPMLTLGALLDAFRAGLVYHVELKGAAPELAAAVHAAVESRGLGSSVVFTSFSRAQLERMRGVSAAARLGWLVESIDDAVLEQAARLGLYQLCPRAARVTAAMVERARPVVAELRAWGLGGVPQEVRRLVLHTVDSGCDGATLDWPDWLAH